MIFKILTVVNLILILIILNKQNCLIRNMNMLGKFFNKYSIQVKDKSDKDNNYKIFRIRRIV